MAFATTLGTTKYNIETKTGEYITVQNNDVKSNGTNYHDTSAQFLVDTGTNANGKLLYRFRLVSDQTKYLAVSGTKLILKNIPSTTIPNDSSHDFYVFTVHEDPDYVKYLYRNSPVGVPQYMSTDSNDDVILAGDSQKAWFRLRVVPDIINTALATTLTSGPDDLVGFEYSEEEAFYGKIIISDRISVSEE